MCHYAPYYVQQLIGQTPFLGTLRRDDNLWHSVAFWSLSTPIFAAPLLSASWLFGPSGFLSSLHSCDGNGRLPGPKMGYHKWLVMLVWVETLHFWVNHLESLPNMRGAVAKCEIRSYKPALQWCQSEDINHHPSHKLPLFLGANEGWST
jgi:hypothetical protein